MYSNKSNYDYGQRRPQSSRASRPWGEEDRREEWKTPPRNSTLDHHDKYIGDGHNWSERVSSSDYTEPYTREYNSDTDWRKKRTSSHERSASEKRRRTLEDDNQYKYQHEPEDSYRQSPEQYSQRNKDFKRTASVEEGYSRRRTPEESRYSQRQDEFHYSQYKEDSHYRPVTEYYKDRDSRERSRSPERTRSRDAFIKSYTPPRPRSDGFFRDNEDHDHNRTRLSLNGSSRLPEPSHRRLSPPPPPPPPPPPAIAAAGEKKMSKGFQRFLDVLNMGVNVEKLKQIVTQGSPDVNVQQPSSPPHVDRPWTAEPTQRLQNPQYQPQTEISHQRPASQLSRTYISNEKTMCEESSLESHHSEGKFSSPTLKTPSFDEEHKRKQVHDVLQAIGIKLEFEELGRMSSRIQERLYGKKQTDSATPNRKEEEEREKRRQAYVPKHRSRSSSGSSSGGSCQTQDYKKSYSHPAQWEEMNFPYQTDSQGTHQSSSNYAAQVISPTTQHRPNPEPPPMPSMPSHVIPPPSSIVHCPPSPYSNLPPHLPPAMPNIFVPQPPPFLSPYPQTPPVPSPNIFPPAEPLRAPFPQPPNKCRRHPYLNLIMVPPAEHSNFANVQKAKNDNAKRHRYLQEVPTNK